MTLNARRSLFTLFLFSAALFSASGCKKVEETQPASSPTNPTIGTTTQPGGPSASSAGGAIRIASYDPTREMYVALNPIFQQYWKEKTGHKVKAETFHGPSGSQAQAIVAGNDADVAALSVDIDIDKIAKAGLLKSDWRSAYPNRSVPYTSAVVFMVRKGNPKNIKDWVDLSREDVIGLAPDPMTGGGARWIYLSTWAHALRKAKDEGKSDAEAEEAARAFTTKVYDKAILDAAMRGSTSRFVQQEEDGGGDVLFGWENEILQVVNDPKSGGKFEIVLPSDSITIEVPIAIVDKVVDRKGTRALAEGYVEYLFSEPGQELIAKFYNRPFDAEVAAKVADKLPPLKLYRFTDHFKDWPSVMEKHFKPGTGELAKIRKAA